MGEFIGLIATVMIFGIPLLAIWTRHQRDLANMGQTGGAAQDGARDRRVEELEDRVAVLERIVTDKGYDVASQIDALRHDRRIDADLEDLRRSREETR